MIIERGEAFDAIDFGIDYLISIQYLLNRSYRSFMNLVSTIQH